MGYGGFFSLKHTTTAKEQGIVSRNVQVHSMGRQGLYLISARDKPYEREAILDTQL